MKFQPDHSSAQSITGYGPGWISVGSEKITRSVVLTSSGQQLDWPCERFEDITPAHFARLAELDAEVIVFGSGSRTRFAPPAWLQSLMAKRVGVEAMDTQAACRTYNILVGEGRNVAVALLLETGQL